MTTPKLFSVSALPATFFLDANGVLQDCVIGDSPLAAAATTRKLERLLAGGDLATDALEKFQERIKEDEKEVDLLFSGEVQTATLQQATPTPAAAKSQPVKIHLKPLWKCDAVHPAGNILVVEPPAGQGAAGVPRIMVIDDFQSVSEIGLDGKLLANHKAKLADKEFFINLRTAAARDGKRYFATFTAQQRVHLFDEKLQYLLSYPADALENPHAGLGDVVLGDLEGDGTLKAYIGFAGTVGVQCVSLQGERHLVLPQSVQCQPRAARSARRKIAAPLILCERRLLVGSTRRQGPIARVGQASRRRLLTGVGPR